MKVAVFEVEAHERAYFAGMGDDLEVLLTAEEVSLDTAQEYLDAEAISTFIYSDLGAASLARFPRLRLIATRSTGFNHIDLPYCRAHGITVCNVPEYADHTVAEHVFALLLAISHNIVKSVIHTKSGNFTQEGLQGFDLQDKTLGVVGTGSIGKHVIRIAAGFGMKVIACDVRPNREAAAALGFSYVSMDELLAASDIITLHVPGTPETRHLISRPQFEAMKPGCVLINTARGEVVDTAALLDSLQKKKVAAAGLDVLPGEPLIREEAELLRYIFDKQDLQSLFIDYVLIHHPNVLITPHNAFNTREAVDRLLRTSVQNLVSFLAGRPQNVVG